MTSKTKARVIPWVGVLIFLWMNPFNINAQTYLTRTYSTLDGLASPTINDIAQDRKGQMWFATLKGISRYDGRAWKNYGELDGLPGEGYSYVRADKQGNVWALRRNLGDGISLFDGKTWSQIQGPPGAAGNIAVKCAALMDDGGGQGVRLGIGTADKGFYIYRSKQNRWLHTTGAPPQDSDDILSIYDAASYNCFFYLATENGLFMINADMPYDWMPGKARTPSPGIYAVAIEAEPYSRGNAGDAGKNGPRIWMAGYRWLGYRDLESDRFHIVHQGPLPGFENHYYYENMTAVPDRFGGLWLGNRMIFLNVDKNGRVKTLGAHNQLQGEGAYAIFYDREANLWVGTFRGLSKLNGFRFENYNRLTGLYDDEVSAIAELGQGDMVFGHNGGFTFFIDNRFYPVKIPGALEKATNVIMDYRVLDMRRDSRGNVWAAVRRKGIVRLTASREMKWYQVQFPGAPRGYYSSVLEDKQGRLVAAVGNRLFQLENDGFAPIETRGQITGNIRRLFNGSSGELYIATTQTGLFRLKENSVVQALSFNANDNHSVYAVFQDKRGRLLVGTGTGLFALEEGVLIPLEEPTLRVNNAVYFITPDPGGSLWFGLNNGVIKWDGREARRYTRQEGLAGSETNRAAGTVDSLGRVWIGTDAGVSCYHRDRDRENRVPPLVELRCLEASGAKYSLESDNFLKHHQDDLTFHFRAISFIDENGIRYNFKLDGFDDRWTYDYQPANDQVRYTHVPPGKYCFYLQAVNSAGIVSETVSSGIIAIKSPIYQAWWFYVLVLSIVLLLIFLGGSFISRRRYAARLEEEVRRRTLRLEASEKELRDIFNTAHDAIIIFKPGEETVFDVNQRACEMYGFTRPEFIGMSMETITSDVHGGKEKIAKTLKRKGNHSFETVQFRKDGREMILEVNASIIDYRGQTAILSFNRDITGKKHAERQLKRSLEEKVIMLKEIHHRVKNNLQIISSLLDLQSESLEDPGVIQAFRDSKNRIRSMALVHENLYQFGDLARIDSGEYVRQVVDYFFSTYGNLGGRIVSSIQVEKISLDMDTAIPIGLILTELLSNALKHAFPPGGGNGKITIRLRSTSKDALSLTVKDNGVGLPDHVEPGETKSLGLKLVSLLTQQVDGRLDIQRRGGTAFTVTFPYRPGAADSN
jgi:PAS domain S-box-containing protein